MATAPPWMGPGTSGGGQSGGQSWKQYLIPALIGLVGAGSSLLKSRAAGKSVEQQQQLYNQWLANRQNGVNDLLERLMSGGANPFGPQVSTQNTQSVSNTIQNMMGKTTQKPVITPQYAPIESALRALVQGKLRAPTALPPGYEQSQVRNINQSYAGAEAAARNAAARYGLSGEAAFGAASPIETARAGKVADFLGTVPLTEREMRNQDIAQAEGLTQAFGLGSEGTSQSTGTTHTTGSSSGIMTTPPNIGALASLMLPPYPNSPVNSGQSLAGNAGGDLALILMQLWMSGAFGGPRPNSTYPGTGIYS